ncbi:TPA: restriction endonuclease subunit S [Stenotrophomonas maltophilia]|nr:restriction endonuclease subunit S [Stenotrophomonas maltophilia]
MMTLMKLELPAGWVETTLGSIGAIKSGVGFPVEAQGKNSGEYPVYKVSDISKAVLFTGGELLHSANYVSEEVSSSLKGYVFPIGTILFAKIGEALRLNRRAIVHARGLADNNVMGFKAGNGLDDKFVFYFLQTQDLASFSRSTTVPSIRKGDVESVSIRLPPASEQKRITQKLDALLARVDALKARIDTIPLLLKRLKSSVLLSAVSGLLSDESRSGWQVVVIRDLVESSLTGLVRSAAEQSDQVGDLNPYLKMNNINQDWGISLEKIVGVRADEEDLKRFELRNGDWLFNTRNSIELVGKSCVWRGEAGFLYNNNILRIRFNSRAVPEFIEIWFRSPLGQSNLAKIKSATTSVAAIYQKALMNQEVNIPDITEQWQIVRRVEQMFAIADQLEAKVAAAKQRINALTQSILAKAFRGDLVPQDPNDEPASVLLERISDQRAAAPKSKRGRKAAAD